VIEETFRQSETAQLWRNYDSNARATQATPILSDEPIGVYSSVHLVTGHDIERQLEGRLVVCGRPRRAIVILNEAETVDGVRDGTYDILRKCEDVEAVLHEALHLGLALLHLSVLQAIRLHMRHHRVSRDTSGVRLVLNAISRDDVITLRLINGLL
jgi:hypothetical protein